MISPRSSWHLILGPTLWGIWFIAIYGGLSAACAVAPPQPEQGPWNWINLALWALTLATVALLVFGAWHCRRATPAKASLSSSSPPRFVPSLAAGLYLMSALATLFIGLPTLVLPPCI